MRFLWTMVVVSAFCGPRLVTDGVYGDTIFYEDFTVDPNWGVTSEFNAGAGDQLSHNSGGGWYEIYLTEEHPRRTKYAESPPFARVDGGSFTVAFDLRYAHSSWGMGMAIRLLDGPTLNGEDYYDPDLDNRSVLVNLSDHHASNPLGALRVDDIDPTTTPSDASPTMDTGAWYSVSIAYDGVAETADILMLHENGSVFFEQAGFSLRPGPFDRIAFGTDTLNDDGTSAEIWFDNVAITPEPALLTLVGLGALRIFWRRKSTVGMPR